MGGFLILLGFTGFVYGAALATERNSSAGVYMLLGGMLMAVGSAAAILPRRAPRLWVFICLKGLVRARGETWEGVEWTDVARFEDATIRGRTVTLRQCRVLLREGTEWGFLETAIADYPRLAEALRAKLEDGGGQSESSGI